MVFGKFFDKLKESREARLEATRLMEKQMSAETAQFRERIEQQTANAIAQNQANYDAEIQRGYNEALTTAKKEIDDKYAEICNTISNVGNEGDDKEDDSRLQGMSDEQKAEIIKHTKVFRRRASVTFLPNQLTSFKFFVNNHITRIAVYGEPPEDFIEACKVKRDEIARLIQEKQKELTQE